ncbi:MAG: glycosyltransferase, partial [Planctomycetes bacterium]|nr:glycosyltransferase [Planctomycetota bacterium]
MTDTPLRFSLVVPIYNEEETVATMLAEVEEVLSPHGPFEALFVDDGSKDRSLEVMRAFKRERDAKWLRIVTLKANSGQSAAVMAGAEQARAPVIATLDGDMQNVPRDIPSMLERVERGEADAVVGVRAQRQDTFVRRASSRIGNGVRNLL